MTLLLLAACGPALVAFPGDAGSGQDTGAADTETGDTDGLGDDTADDTGLAPDDTGPCVGSWHPDADGDGFGDATNISADCDAPAGWIADGTDCDDGAAAVFPGAAETCDDRDEDCDGAADEGDVCAGATEEHEAAEAGWTVVGGSANDGVGAGGAITTADLDRDGWPELVVTAPLFGATDAGAVAVHGADTAALGVAFDAGVVVSGADAGDRFGSCLALLGDLDGNGWDELLVGAPLTNGEETDGGAAWVFELSEGPGEIEDRAIGEIVGGSSSGLLGSAVASGDLDGDGLPELVVGAPGESSGRGRVYVGDGEGSWWERSVDADELDGAYVGVRADDALGTTVAAAEDLDGDGYGEVVACGPGADDAGTDAGACWIVAGGWREDGEDGQDIGEVASATFTGAVAGDAVGYGPNALVVADLDGDGAMDLALGAPGWDGLATDGGAVAAWWGGALAGTYDLDGADLLVAGEGALGRALAGLADVDGDGASELLAGAPSTAEGTLHLFTGLSTGGRIDAPDAAAARWTGVAMGDAFGSTVGALADVDGDGAVDIAASAPANDPTARNAGTIYVLSP